jgi:hypothetical protein
VTLYPQLAQRPRMGRMLFPDDDAEVVMAPGTRSGEVFGHANNLTLPGLTIKSLGESALVS